MPFGEDGSLLFYGGSLNMKAGVAFLRARGENRVNRRRLEPLAESIRCLFNKAGECNAAVDALA